MHSNERGESGSQDRAGDDSAVSNLGDRRQFLKRITVAGLAGVMAGCLGGDDDGTETPGGMDTGTRTATQSPVSFTIRSIDPEEVTVTRPRRFTVEANIENSGEETGTRTVELRVDGDVVASTELELSPGTVEAVTLEASSADIDPGPHTHSVATADDEVSGTLTVESFLSDDPEPLFSFDAEGPLRLSIGTNTIEGTVISDYTQPLEDVEVELQLPEGWTIEGEATKTIGSIESVGRQSVSWDLSVPNTGDQREFDLTAVLDYSVVGEKAEGLSSTLPVETPLSIPFGMDCGGAHTATTVTIDDLDYIPTSDVSEGVTIQPFEDDVRLHQNRRLSEEEAWWPGAVSPTPNPAEGPGALSGYRPLVAADASGNTRPDIGNTQHDSLYWTEQHGSDLSYEFNVPPSTYDVTVHLAEVWWDGEGQRVFDLSIGGETTTGINLYADAGPDTAFRVTETVDVTDGPLTVSTTSRTGVSTVAGIEIREEGNAPSFGGSGQSGSPEQVDARAVYTFDDGLNDWTVEADDLEPRDISYGSYGSAGIEVDGTDGPLLASTAVPGDDKQIDSASFFMRETENSTGSAVLFMNESGNREIGFALDNPQWFVGDADGTYKVWDPGSDGQNTPPDTELAYNQFYEQWVYVEIDFDWNAAEYELRVRNLEAEVEDSIVLILTTTGSLGSGTNVAEIQLSNFNIGENGFDSADACYAWFDDIRIT